MKAFEKWDEEWENSHTDKRRARAPYWHRKDAWRAALEWIANHKWFDDPYMLAKTVEQELEKD